MCIMMFIESMMYAGSLMGVDNMMWTDSNICVYSMYIGSILCIASLMC